MTSHTRALAAITACAVALAACSLFTPSGEAIVTTVMRHAGGPIANDGEYLYVTDSGLIKQIRLSDYIVTNSFAPYDSSAECLGICTDGSNLYYNMRIHQGSAENTWDDYASMKLVLATGEITTLHVWPRSIGIATDGVKLYTATRNTICTMSLYSGEWWTTGVIREVLHPHSLCSDGTNLYITSDLDFLIYKASPATGEAHVIAGQWGIYERKDGVGASATFRTPYGIATDGTNLFIADGNTIRKMILSTGEVITIAGSDEKGFADGPGTWARFNGPTGITYYDGSLYVADSVNQAIRRVQLP